MFFDDIEQFKSEDILFGWIPSLTFPNNKEEIKDQIKLGLIKANYKKSEEISGEYWEKTVKVRDTIPRKKEESYLKFVFKIESDIIVSVGSLPLNENKINENFCKVEFIYELGLVKIKRNQNYEKGTIALFFAQIRDIFHSHLYHEENIDFLLEPCWVKDKKGAVIIILKQYKDKISEYMARIKRKLDLYISNSQDATSPEPYIAIQNQISQAQGEMNHGIAFLNTTYKNSNFIQKEDYEYFLNTFNNAKKSLEILRKDSDNLHTVYNNQYFDYKKPISMTISAFYMLYFSENLLKILTPCTFTIHITEISWGITLKSVIMFFGYYGATIYFFRGLFFLLKLLPLKFYYYWPHIMRPWIAKRREKTQKTGSIFL
jgi:hypothetical protein